MLDTEGFEINVIIATVGMGTVIENLMLKIFGAYPIRQPIMWEAGFFVGRTHIPYNSVVIVLASVGLMLVLAALLSRTRMGRAIRAVSQNREAAQLMGVPFSWSTPRYCWWLERSLRPLESCSAR